VRLNNLQLPPIPLHVEHLLLQLRARRRLEFLRSNQRLSNTKLSAAEANINLIMNTDAIADFLAEQRDTAPAELQHLFINFEDYWERKLWHQLTDSLIEFFNNPQSGPQRLSFYRTFILTFADKINQLKLVTLALNAATQCKGGILVFERLYVSTC
jgi:hypothetical protein